MIALTMTTNLPASPNKSCFTCKNLKTWDYPGTLEDPPDEGWDCGIKDYEPTELIDEALDEIDEDIDAVRLAKNCQRYEFFDWDAYHKAAADSEAEYDFPDVDPKLCPDAIPYASYYF